MREKIRLNSSAGTGHFYTTDKNKRTMPEKMEVKKKHVPIPHILCLSACVPKILGACTNK